MLSDQGVHRLFVCQVEYSRQYAETNPSAQSLRHLLSEAHLLLCSSLLQTTEQTHRKDLEEALRENCAQLGDCFSRYMDDLTVVTKNKIRDY